MSRHPVDGDGYRMGPPGEQRRPSGQFAQTWSYTIFPWDVPGGLGQGNYMPAPAPGMPTGLPYPGPPMPGYPYMPPGGLPQMAPSGMSNPPQLPALMPPGSNEQVSTPSTDSELSNPASTRAVLGDDGGRASQISPREHMSGRAEGFSSDAGAEGERTYVDVIDEYERNAQGKEELYVVMKTTVVPSSKDKDKGKGRSADV
ncbi:hypothetical protein EJ06DRAFT_584484 [Trichodelitschia bisporula]|uniref:Uncharacterized protein n=1 Tax=Trichodelitschia bisporula TaxID=703511 RepID=A0A6G1HNS7_9PEZI|nr:hypothetical protein EJ06DRAFT_584484 [Trichodelitschia bisporula]